MIRCSPVIVREDFLAFPEIFRIDEGKKRQRSFDAIDLPSNVKFSSLAFTIARDCIMFHI